MDSIKQGWAQRYLAEGERVVPVRAGTKSGLPEGWQTEVFTAADFQPDSNVSLLNGIETVPGRFSVDVDVDAREALRAAAHFLPPTGRIYGRPSKPRSHYRYTTPSPVTHRSLKDADGSMIIEFRGLSSTKEPTQSVVPPSVHTSGEVYRFDEEGPVGHVESEDHLERMVVYTAIAAVAARHWPTASRHHAAGALAGFLKRAGVDEIAIPEIIRQAALAAGDEEAADRERYARDTVAKIKSGSTRVTGGTTVKELLGADLVRVIFKFLGKEDEGEKELVLADMNARHFIARIGNDEVIAREDGRRVIFQSKADLGLRYENTKVMIGRDRVGKPVFQAHDKFWRKHRERRQYDLVAFAPPGHDPRVVHFDSARDFNLWRGFAVEPDPNPRPELRCKRYLAHILEVVCSGNQEHAEFLLDWMADCVQRPGRPAEVAVALRGEPGAGKGIFVRGFMSLFGDEHSIQIDKSKHLTGAFNAQLSAKIIVFADEAVWAGDKSERGALKRLITEPTLTIERKGIDAATEPNFIHLITATNEDWSVPAELRERRWFVPSVSDHKTQDTEYFGALQDELNNGGREALLAFLLGRNVTRNLRNVPKTQELARQQELSLNPIESYLLDALYRGTPLTPRGEEFASHAGRTKWEGVKVTVSDWYADFRQTTGRSSSRIGEKTFSMRIALLLPRKWATRDNNRRGYKLGSLEAARRHFDFTMKTKRAWDDEPRQQGLPLSEIEAWLATLPEGERKYREACLVLYQAQLALETDLRLRIIEGSGGAANLRQPRNSEVGGD